MNEVNHLELSRREQIEGSWPPVDLLVIFPAVIFIGGITWAVHFFVA